MRSAALVAALFLTPPAVLLSTTACGGREPESSVVGRSSDGLVFARLVDASIDLARARISDGEVIALTRDAGGDEAWPYWSDVSGRLVFQRAPAGRAGASDLWLWDPGRGEIPLSETPGREERWPAWSPTEARLVYAFRGGRPPAGLVLAEAEGGHALLAVSGPRDIFLRPSFAPDGRSIVAQRRDDGGRGSALWILAPDSTPRALTGGGGWFDMKAHFTRDGTRLLFTRRPSAGTRRHIASVDVAGGAIRRVDDDEEGGDDHSARPSPARDEMAFVSDRAGGSDIFIQDLTDGEARNLTRSPDVDEFAPRWSPDGERLVVTAAAGGDLLLRDRASLERARVRVLDREGRVLFDAPGFMADWMPPW